MKKNLPGTVTAGRSKWLKYIRYLHVRHVWRAVLQPDVASVHFWLLKGHSNPGTRMDGESVFVVFVIKFMSLFWLSRGGRAVTVSRGFLFDFYPLCI